MIKNIVIIILLALIVLFGYNYLNDQYQDNEIIDQEEIVEENQEEEEIDYGYCYDIKERTVDQEENFVVFEGIKDNFIYPGYQFAGCVYFQDETYGGWAPFEAQVGYYTVQSDGGEVLGQGPLSVSNQNWMEAAIANEDIQFISTIEFDASESGSGELIIRNDNIAGDPDGDREIIIPVNY